MLGIYFVDLPYYHFTRKSKFLERVFERWMHQVTPWWIVLEWERGVLIRLFGGDLRLFFWSSGCRRFERYRVVDEWFDLTDWIAADTSSEYQIEKHIGAHLRAEREWNAVLLPLFVTNRRNWQHLCSPGNMIGQLHINCNIEFSACQFYSNCEWRITHYRMGWRMTTLLSVGEYNIPVIQENPQVWSRPRQNKEYII